MPKPENLIPFRWKKGQSGNPNGRPKKVPELQLLMAAILAEEKEGRSAAEYILAKMREKASKGDIKAAEFLFSYGYGKPTQRIELPTEGTTIKIVRE